MLPRPGQLLHRWTPDDLDQEDQDGRAQIDGDVLPSLDEGGRHRPTPPRNSRVRNSASNHPAIIDFLANNARSVIRSPKDGTIEIPLAEFEGAQFLEIIVAAPSSSQTTYLPLPPIETQLRDRRIARPLAPDSHHLATRFAAALAPGAEAEIENLLDADWRAFTTHAEAHQFLLATTGDNRLRTFTFLTTWPDFDEKEKLALLADHHCHELHLFLSRKDPEFFEKHIKPLLTAKPEPQFIDDYLLARDLDKYLRPYAFSRLNAAEKALLAQALPARKADIARELDIRWKAEAPTPDAETILFSKTLKGADLSPTDSLGLARNKEDMERNLTSAFSLGDEAVTRTFPVPPDFSSSLSGDGDEAADPFAETSGSKSLAARPPIIELLRRSGVVLPEGSSATLSADGKLVVTGPPDQLDMIGQLTETYGSIPTGGAEDDAFAAGNGLDPEAGNSFRGARPRLFPDRTRLWLESNYYKHRGSTGEDLIPLNRFWLELSAWDGKRPFTSPHFNACTSSAADALMCLAMLDLPFTAGKPEVTVEESTLKVKAVAPMLLFYKDTRRTENVAIESPLLVRQSYHPLAEPFRTDVQGRKIENTVTGDFRTGVPYGLSMVITNPTGTERRIETLAQIPAGAIPLASYDNKELAPSILPPLDGLAKHAPETLSTSHLLEPYGVVQLQLAFYFPADGDYPAYPLHVSEGEQILAHAQSRILRVSADPAPEDSASWLVLARDGTSEDVLNRLSTADLSQSDLREIWWRLQDKDFFLKASEILRNRLLNAPEISLYGILHDDPSTITEYLRNIEFSDHLGQWFSSKLINIDPVTNHHWETMEFDPLVNARAHQFGENPRLTHAQAREHYHAFLDTLIWKPVLTSADQITFTYHLFLQDRIAEALSRFAKIKSADLPDPLQYDYLHAVALFYQAKPVEAKIIADKYLEKLPPGTWLDRFQSVSTQAKDIATPVPTLADEESDTRPALEITQQSDGKLLLKHANLNDTTLSLYHIDLEVLFSKDPFLKGGAESSLPPIAPNQTTKVSFEKGSMETPYELPNDFRQGNILIAAESDHAKQLKILDSRQLETLIVPLNRTIQIIDPATNKPLPSTYIKVFVESGNGSVEFHKDGYTDLRGKFDYLSHTATDPSTVRRVAILVSHPEKGSLTRIVER